MERNILKVLTMFLLSVIPIVSIGQITLTDKQYKFYAKALVIKQGLEIDTAIYRAQLRDCDKIEALRNQQISGYKSSLQIQEAITNQMRDSTKYQKALRIDLQEKYDKKNKWNTRWKKALFGVTAVAIIEALFIYFVVVTP
ncbi:MAG: hypothetical protein K0S44_236 [Bacteroidetes bacterium]|nr:hypothetical protein [Bacteroidota bacterium]